MPTCKTVAEFLGQVRARAVTTVLSDGDAAQLTQLQLVQFLTAEEVQTLSAEVAQAPTVSLEVERENADRARLAGELQQDVARDHSILFHLHGKETQAVDLDQEAKDRAQFQAETADLAQKELAFNQLLGKRAMLDSLTPYGDRSVALTVAGAVALRDLNVRLYRFADTDFAAYLAQAQRIDQELDSLATGAATYVRALAGGIPGADPDYLWAIGIGLAKSKPDPATGVAQFLAAYGATANLSSNAENRLMASEILAGDPRPLADEAQALGQLVHDVRGIGVPKESALGVASIVLFGRRADGSFALEGVREFLKSTRSYESAALLGIVNEAPEAVGARFQALRQLFAQWGYRYSEDTELSAAYLAVSDNDPQQVGPKLAILARGLAAYLQYPLVAAAILGSITTLEANEGLNLVEKAYAVIGRRASGLSQTELICLAVRMVHGIRNELVGTLDATAAAAPAAAGGFYGPHGFFMPIVIAHYGYYATYGGIAGVHPGHVHGMPTGFGGAGVG